MKHPRTPQKLATAEWLVTEGVCSLLHPVPEVATKTQGGGRRLSQSRNRTQSKISGNAEESHTGSTYDKNIHR